MSKTAPIPDDVHALIIDKQTELKRRHKITVKISDLIAMYVKYGIKKTEKLLGLKTEGDQDIVDDIKQDIINNSESTDVKTVIREGVREEVREKKEKS